MADQPVAGFCCQNGESGEGIASIHAVNDDGTLGDELVPPPKYVFESLLADLKRLGLDLNCEIDWTMPLPSEDVIVRLQLTESSSNGLALLCSYRERGNDIERKQLQEIIFETGAIDLTDV